MAIFNYEQQGVAPSLQFGNGGGQIDWMTDHFEITDGSSNAVQVRVPVTPVDQRDASSKRYTDSFAVSVRESNTLVASKVTDINFEGSTFDITSSGGGQVTVTGVRVPMSIITEPNAARNAQLTDDCNYVLMTSNTPSTFTVQNDATVNFPVGAVITLEQAGAGQLTVVAGAGTVINCAALLTARAQFAVLMLVKKGPNLWTLTGDLNV